MGPLRELSRAMKIDLASGEANGFGTDLLFAVYDVVGTTIA